MGVSRNSSILVAFFGNERRPKIPSQGPPKRDIDTDMDRYGYRVDSKKLECGPGTNYHGFPSSLGFGVGRQLSSNFVASTLLESPISGALHQNLWAPNIGPSTGILKYPS